MNASISRAVSCRHAFLLAGLGWTLAAFAQAPQPQDFAFRAPLEVPASASVARAGIPAQALARLQSADARDVRIFNAAGEVVPFAIAAPPAPAAQPTVSTPAFAALPLYGSTATGDAKSKKGAMQVRIEDGQRSVWVQVDGQQPAAGATKIDSVIFDTRGQKQLLSSLKVQAGLPANAPVRMAVSASGDLARWTPVPVRGRLFRFEGAEAPANEVLEFEQPVALEGRYLRLDWSGQEGVTVASVTGTIATASAPARIRAALPAFQPQSKGLEMQLPFATPIAALVLTTPDANALLPVRILGRNEPSQPWRVLSSTVVYRLGAAGNDSTNPPVALHRASVRWLRVESTQAADLSSTKLDASAEFEPVQLVFVANGSAPFQLAAGRADTPGAALPLGVLSAALGGKRVDELPEAVVGAGTVAPAPRAESGLFAVIQQAGISRRTALLWAVLVAGVLLLGGVAWSLMRQLKGSPPAE